MDTTKRLLRVEERFALEAIEAIEDVASYRWLPEGSRRMPDLEVMLCDSRVAAVEITLSTDGATRSLYSSFDRKWWPRSDLEREWVVLLCDHGPGGRERRRSVTDLIDKIAPVLGRVESQGDDVETMIRSADCEVARFAPPDWDAVTILRCCPSDAATGGGVRTRVAAGYGGQVGSVDALIEAVQERIYAKGSRGQLDGFSGPKWLVVSLDSGLPSKQLEDVAASEDDASRRADIEAILFTGIDEVWIIGSCFVRNIPRVVLRLFSSGPAPEWHTVEAALRKLGPHVECISAS